MDELLELIAARGYMVMLWKNEGQGWLACLMDDGGDRLPDTTIWNYQDSPTIAVARLNEIAEQMPNIKK